ncbi:hypothetical protein QA649_33740 [Bradyrhizobium sp. CB1717]|uniref:hypothetical protein n=1 Tax=Bradyrhizobium sp. CB1717 TaxID=3039154 RepID=UPI0024B1AA83|nr:hypothetical protein [Bradyrhizobium sp. CB1717]WFU23008.1 hypothetical protein QA649_33740 [Bradyrhizobium sp. CB1717]
MTPMLLLSRDCIICWVNIWIAPIECAFDLIESELARRGIALEAADQVAPHTA